MRTYCGGGQSARLVRVRSRIVCGRLVESDDDDKSRTHNGGGGDDCGGQQQTRLVCCIVSVRKDFSICAFLLLRATFLTRAPAFAARYFWHSAIF